MRRPALCLLLAAVAHAEKGKTAFPITKSDRTPSISLDEFNRMLHTEALSEFGVRHLTTADYDALWEAAIDHEWMLAEMREEMFRSGHDRRIQHSTAAVGGTSPFFVCDEHLGLNGEDALANIRSHLGDELIPVYNRVDMTCAVIEALPSLIQNLPAGISATPLSASMKMQQDLSDWIASSDPIPGTFQARFCEGQTTSYEDGVFLATEILHDLTELEGRSRRAKEFIGTSGIREEGRHEHWQRTLERLDDVYCLEMIADFELEVSDEGNTMSLLLPLGLRSDSLRTCMQQLVVELAMQPEVCFVSGVEDAKALNVLASGIVQSGTANSKPFYIEGLDGEGQVVAMSDTGLDVDNCYFWDAINEVSKDISGRFDLSVRKVVQYYTYADNTDDANEGHGTHVAGSIVGRRAITGRSESNGAADGVAKGAKLAFFDIGYTGTNGLRVPTSATTLFNPGYQAGARIHSASWGTTSNSYTQQVSSMDDYMAGHPDFLFIAAAGNSGHGNALNSVGSPATTKNGIAVGATQNDPDHLYDYMLGPDYLTYFSSRGPTADGRLKPDILAPGLFIESANSKPGSGECDSNGGIRYNAGTSMAAPIVAGAAALVRQYFVQGWHLTGSASPSDGINPTASLVKAVLLNSGKKIIGIQGEDRLLYNTREYDYHQGFGRVNMLSSLPLSGRNSINAIFVNGETIRNGREDEYTVTIDTSGTCDEPLSATLVWTDPAGSPFCANCVLNDLDLYVTRSGQSGRSFPNGRSSRDTENNVERVRIEEPVNGATYTIHVEGTDLIQRQDYSLVISGCFNNGDGNSGGGGSGGNNGGGNNGGGSSGGGSSGGGTNGGGSSGSGNSGNGGGDCSDSVAADIQVEDNLFRNCQWLQANIGSYRYLCEFMDVASLCPATCNACNLLSGSSGSEGGLGPVQRATLGYDGVLRWDGNMFDIQAKTDLVLTGLNAHLNYALTYDIRVYTRRGTFVGHEASANGWEVFCEWTVTSDGFGFAAEIPDSACNSLALEQGEIRGVHVTTTRPDMVMTGGDIIGDVAFENSDIRVRQGIAVSHDYTATFSTFKWNGELRYQTSSEGGGSATSCLDRTDDVLVNNYVGHQSCDWISNNRVRAEDACMYVAVATHCPQTCNICSRLQ